MSTLNVCRMCGGEGMCLVVDLGVQALTGVFPKAHEPDPPKAPLRIVRCNTCGLAQLADTFDLSALYGPSYGYHSNLNASMVEHLESIALWAWDKVPTLSPGDVVVDIGANDGTLLAATPPMCHRIGIDPLAGKWPAPDGVEMITAFWPTQIPQARIITSIAMFYDLPDPIGAAKAIATALTDDGVWACEVAYMPRLMTLGAYDTICHEHLEYYGMRDLRYITSAVGLVITDVRFTTTNGGSVLIAAQHNGIEHPLVAASCAAEESALSESSWASFQATAEAHRDWLCELLAQPNTRWIGLGASTKGNVVLQWAGIDATMLPVIGDINPDKAGCVTPGTRIPITTEADALAAFPTHALVLPWHFMDSISIKITGPELVPLFGGSNA